MPHAVHRPPLPPNMRRSYRLRTPVRRALIATAAAGIAVSMSVGVAFSGTCWYPEGVGLEGDSGKLAAHLLADDWVGDPDDGREALYPPACVE